MPLVYADTSVLFAFFHPRDQFAVVLAKAMQRQPVDFVYWSFLRFELRHNIRQSRIDTYGEVAWKALRAAERTQARLRWFPELKSDSILEAADELSGQLAGAYSAGSGDFLHIAAARRLRLLSSLDEFWTCDREQSKAAKATGLVVRLFAD